MNNVLQNLDFIVKVILSIGLVQGTFLCFSLIKSNTKKIHSNYLLATLIFIFTIILIQNYLVNYNWILKHLIVFYITFSIPLLIGPFLFFYTAFLLNNKYRFYKRDLLHFLPFFLMFVYFEFILKDHIKEVQYSIGEIPFYISYLGVVKALHLITYVLYTFIKIQQFKERESYNREKCEIIIRWLYIFIKTFIVILLIEISTFILGHFKIPYSYLLDDISIITLTFLLYIIAFVTIKYPVIFGDSLNKVIKYESSTLNKKEKELLKERVINYIEIEKPYLNSELKLNDFAEAINIPIHHLSQLINELFKLTFQEFMNYYRVEEVKKCLDNFNEHEKRTFLGIAMDSGFNSKAVFNRAFKKFTKMTPSEYRRSKGL